MFRPLRDWLEGAPHDEGVRADAVFLRLVLLDELEKLQRREQAVQGRLFYPDRPAHLAEADRLGKVLELEQYRQALRERGQRKDAPGRLFISIIPPGHGGAAPQFPFRRKNSTQFPVSIRRRSVSGTPCIIFSSTSRERGHSDSWCGKSVDHMIRSTPTWWRIST